MPAFSATCSWVSFALVRHLCKFLPASTCKSFLFIAASIASLAIIIYSDRNIWNWLLATVLFSYRNKEAFHRLKQYKHHIWKQFVIFSSCCCFFPLLRKRELEKNRKFSVPKPSFFDIYIIKGSNSICRAIAEVLR
jgi:hypothetical protein